MEFGASVLGAEPPVDGGPGGVAPDLIRVDGSSQRHFVPVASLQAVSGQHAEFDLRHIQPTAVFGCVVKLQAFHDAASLRRREGFVRRRHAMGVQSLPRTRYGVVENDADHGGVRVGHVHQPPHLVGEVLHGAPLRDGQMAPAKQRWRRSGPMAGG